MLASSAHLRYFGFLLLSGIIVILITSYPDTPPRRTHYRPQGRTSPEIPESQYGIAPELASEVVEAQFYPFDQVFEKPRIVLGIDPTRTKGFQDDDVLVYQNDRANNAQIKQIWVPKAMAKEGEKEISDGKVSGIDLDSLQAAIAEVVGAGNAGDKPSGKELSNAESWYNQKYMETYLPLFKFNSKAKAKYWEPHVRSTDRCIEFGSNSGHSLAALPCRAKAGVEISAVARAFARRRFGLTTHERSDALEAASFDLAFTSSVLEHVECPVCEIRGLFRALRPGGHLVATVPGMSPAMHAWQPNDINMEFYTFGALQLGNMLSVSGFDVRHCRSELTQYPDNYQMLFGAVGPEIFSRVSREWAETHDRLVTTYCVGRKPHTPCPAPGNTSAIPPPARGEKAAMLRRWREDPTVKAWKADWREKALQGGGVFGPVKAYPCPSCCPSSSKSVTMMDNSVCPMMQPEEIEFFRAGLTAKSKVWEWGTGISTLYFAQCVRSWTSIEHDPDWCAQMKALRPPTVDVICVPMEAGHAEQFAARRYDGSKLEFRSYVEAARGIRDFDPDVVLIDGRARADCAIEILPFIKADCDVYIHDWIQERLGPPNNYGTVLDYYDVADQVHVSTGNNQASGMVRLRAKRSALEAARLAEARRPPDDSHSSATVQRSERGSR